MLQIRQISAQKEVQEDLLQRYATIDDRLRSLKVENDEVSPMFDHLTGYRRSLSAIMTEIQ